jgi:hypothetical protein
LVEYFDNLFGSDALLRIRTPAIAVSVGRRVFRPVEEMVMTRLLPALHEGHAPIHLHYAFEDALEAFEIWVFGAEEPEVAFEGREVPISAVFGRMRTCSDLLPQRTLDLVCDVLADQADALRDNGETYAGAAFVLRALCIDRLRDKAA